MKTRDRILECALQLFNQKGEPNVSTMEVANEMGISPDCQADFASSAFLHSVHSNRPTVMRGD